MNTEGYLLHRLITLEANDRKMNRPGPLLSLTKLKEILDDLCLYCKCRYRTMTVDRIDNRLGHSSDNCVPACHICNWIKGDRFTTAEMVSMRSSAPAEGDQPRAKVLPTKLVIHATDAQNDSTTPSSSKTE